MLILEARDAAQYARGAELIAEYFRSWGIEPAQDRWLTAELGDLALRYGEPTGCLLIAEVDGRAAGVVALRRLEPGTCLMKRMFVRPAFRRRGVARALAVALLERARALGYRRMVLDTPADNEPALALYRSLGFAATEPYEEPHDHEHDDDHHHPHEGWSFLAADLATHSVR